MKSSALLGSVADTSINQICMCILKMSLNDQQIILR